MKDLSQIYIPRRIKTLVQGRLEHLDEECRQVLSTAALIDRELSSPVLHQFSGMEEISLVDLIDRCLQARLVVERRIPGEELYALADTQFRDVPYEGISPIRRRRHDLRVSKVLEKLYAKKMEEHLDELAHHFLEENDLPKAVDCSIKAGDKAARMFA